MGSCVLPRLPAQNSKLLDLEASLSACFSRLYCDEIDSIQICHRCFSCAVAHKKMAVFSCAGAHKLQNRRKNKKIIRFRVR